MASGKIGFLLQFFSVTPVNEYRPATGGMAAIHITPAIANHPALREVNF